MFGFFLSDILVFVRADLKFAATSPSLFSMATIPLAKEAAMNALLTGGDETSERIRDRTFGAGTEPKKLIHAHLRSHNRRPESRLSTLYKTGYVPNTNTKESLKITKRARFATQDHLLTYPMYKSVYTGFSTKHPKMIKVGERALKRADSIPPLRATLDLKDKAAKRMLTTADHLIPGFRSVDVKPQQHIRSQTLKDRLQFGERAVVDAPTRESTSSRGFNRVKKAFKTLGERIQNIAVPMLPERLRRQFDRDDEQESHLGTTLTTPAVETAPATGDSTALIELLYEKQYQILVQILDNNAAADYDLCDLVKFLYVRSSTDGENGKKLSDLLQAFGAEAAGVVTPDAEGVAASDLANNACETGDKSDNDAASGAKVAARAAKKKAAPQYASTQNFLSGNKVDASKSKGSQMKVPAQPAKVAKTTYGPSLALLEETVSFVSVPPRGPDVADDESSSHLSMYLSILVPENKLSGRVKHNKSVRFTEAKKTRDDVPADIEIAPTEAASSVSVVPSQDTLAGQRAKTVQVQKNEISETSEIAENAEIAAIAEIAGSASSIDPWNEEDGYLAQIASREVLDSDLLSFLRSHSGDINLTDYAYQLADTPFAAESGSVFSSTHISLQ